MILTYLIKYEKFDDLTEHYMSYPKFIRLPEDKINQLDFKLHIKAKTPKTINKYNMYTYWLSTQIKGSCAARVKIIVGNFTEH